MTPKSYSVKNGTTYFHYSFSEMRQYVNIGNNEGTAGPLLKSRNGNMLTYWMYGTFDNPCTTRSGLTLNHHPLFDGKMLTDDERLLPEKPFFTKENTSFFIFNVNET